MYFYRTHDGAECDVVLVKGIVPIACIEIKLNNAPVISKGFYTSVADLINPYQAGGVSKSVLWVKKKDVFSENEKKGLSLSRWNL